jgi:hypothetical protein
VKPIRYLSPGRIQHAVKREYKTLRHALRSRHFARFFGTKPQGIRQQPSRLAVDFGDVSNCSELGGFLVRNNIRFAEGKHTIYILPQEKFFKITGLESDLYPPNAGFKLLKRFSPVGRASYLIDGYRQPVERAMLGRLENQADAANLLHCLGLGPRLYDLAEIQSARFKTGCFVVQHIDGAPPSHDEWSIFMEQMQDAVKNLDGALALVRPEGWGHCDFDPPDCGGNLLRRVSDGALFYIDFQQFAVVDKAAVIANILDDSSTPFHFGGTRRVLGSKRYLYQSMPGIREVAKRDVQKRWRLIQSLLVNAGISLTERLVLDICCNAGMFISLALANGARMGMGWDLPEVIAQAKRLQSILGNTRALLFPARLDAEYRLSKDIPTWMAKNIEGSIVFYLAAWRHVGFIADLACVPWSALVFEGHQEDTEEETQTKLSRMEDLWGCRLVSRAMITDGDSDVRPVALLVRD